MKWLRLETGDYISECKKYKITPEYWGCVRPTKYILYVDSKRYCGENTLRQAKETALQRSLING